MTSRKPDDRNVAPHEAPDAASADAAVLAFLDGWRQLQQGEITAGGSLVVRYEPARFVAAREAAEPVAPREIVGYARFLPGGQVRHATLRARRGARAVGSAAPSDGGAPVAAQIAVPPETRHVELWFQCIDADGRTIWDSRFGENYRFDVVRPRPRPAESLHRRTGAVVDPAVIAVAEDAAVKTNAFAASPGHPAVGANLQTTLHVAARVHRAVETSSVWIDAHFFDGAASLIHGDTLPLRHAGPADERHELFVLDGTLYQGTVATPGSVSPRPDVRAVQYRLYCEVGDRIVTDGELHVCELATDAVSS